MIETETFDLDALEQNAETGSFDCAPEAVLALVDAVRALQDIAFNADRFMQPRWMRERAAAALKPFRNSIIETKEE